MDYTEAVGMLRKYLKYQCVYSVVTYSQLNDKLYKTIYLDVSDLQDK